MKTSTLPAISVIIPVYNTQEYIEACLHSICSQSLQAIEVICVDDGSTDRSAELLDAYSRRDPRVHVIHQANAGVSAARNAGIQAARGEYILFADSDDTFKDGAFELLYQEAQRKALDILFFDADTAYASESLQREYAGYSSYYHRRFACAHVCDGEQMFVLMQQANAYRAHCCLQMIRRNHLTDSGIRFPQDTRVHEDDLFSLRLLLLAQKTCYLPQCLYIRRIRFNSAVTSAYSKGFEHFDGYFKLYLRMHRHLQENPLRSGEAQAALCAYLRYILNRCMTIYKELPAQEKARLEHALPEVRYAFDAFLSELLYAQEQAERRERALQQPLMCIKNLAKAVLRRK